jgi:hypothetical protein
MGPAAEGVAKGPMRDVHRQHVGETWHLRSDQSKVAAGNLIVLRNRQRHLQRVGDVTDTHGGAQFPGDDVTGEVIEHGGEIEPAPADHLEEGEVGLPEPPWSCS